MRLFPNGRQEQGSAYIAVIILVALLFIWATFQLEGLIQNQQTMQYDHGIVQAQYLAESGIEQMRARLRAGTEGDGSLDVQLKTGSAEVEIIETTPLKIRSIGRVAPNTRQTITVELDPETLQVSAWSRKRIE